MTHRRLQYWLQVPATALVLTASGQALAEEMADVEAALACGPVSRAEEPAALDFCPMPGRSRSLGQRECRTAMPTAPAIMARVLIGDAGVQTAHCGANYTPVPTQTVVTERCEAATTLWAYRRGCAAAGDCDRAYLALTRPYAEALQYRETGCF